MHSAPMRIKGFTLIEMMVVVAIIAILAAIALPAYSDYVKRANLVDATNQLAASRAQMEQYYQDARKYTTSGPFTSPCANIASVNLPKWTFDCPAANLTATTYTIRATGIGAMNGWVFTIDQLNTQTTAAPTGWVSSSSKFCMNKSCT